MEATDAGLFDPWLGRSSLMLITTAILLASAITAGASLLGGAGSMIYNSVEAQKTRDHADQREDLAYERNSAEAERAREFSAEQRKTAYQDTVQDMEAAGLNPAAMYGSFNGASGAYSTNAATAPTAGAGPSASIGGNAFDGAASAIRTAFLLNRLKHTPGGLDSLKELSKGMQMGLTKSAGL